jgi:Secretin and TonB N terminus short domain
LTGSSTIVGRSLGWNARYAFFYKLNTLFCRALCLALIGATALQGALADPHNGPADPAASITFDLPAQPLASALESYSISSGWQVIYDAGLATGRRSTRVNGEFTPADALRLLLAGTGLVPQYMAADGVMLIPDPALAGTQVENPQTRYRSYYGRIQVALKRAFCTDRQIRSGSWRIALGFWIGSSGTVTRAAALGSTGDAEIDAAFDRAVHTLSIGDGPPAGFRQPVVILVTPDLTSQCDAAGSRMPPARAER